MASAGHRHSVLLRSDGKATVAGSNVYGQCNLQRNSKGVKQVVAGGEHSLLLFNNGEVTALGNNEHGQCSLPSLLSLKRGVEYVQVSAGHKHSVALRSDGEVEYAGINYGGDIPQLHIDEIAPLLGPPVKNKALVDDVILRDDPKLALKSSEWANMSHRGIVESPRKPSPRKLAIDPSVSMSSRRDSNGGDSPELPIEPTMSSQRRRDSNGGDFPELPIESTNFSSPDVQKSQIKPEVDVETNAVRWIQLSAGYAHTALLRSNGIASAYGRNESGQCNMPKEGGFVQVSAGGAHTVLLHENGNAMAIGSNSHQQCDIAVRSTCSTVRYVRVSAGRRHTVLLRSDGCVEAVGCNDDGQCEIPPLESGLKYLQASAGGYHTVLLRSDGQALTVGSHSGISIPALAKYQSWFDWAQTKPVLPEGVEYVPDFAELPVATNDKRDLIVRVSAQDHGAVAQVRCLSLAGKVLAAFDAPLDAAVDVVYALMIDKLKVESKRLQAILPSGRLLKDCHLNERFYDMAKAR
jgi:alpha-tubulin suppressor-like RCC1 family protein